MVLFHSGSDVRQLQGRQEINTIETNANGSSHGVLYVLFSKAPMEHRDDLVGVAFFGALARLVIYFGESDLRTRFS